jgi:hypothetical protein
MCQALADGALVYVRIAFQNCAGVKIAGSSISS